MSPILVVQEPYGKGVRVRPQHSTLTVTVHCKYSIAEGLVQ